MPLDQLTLALMGAGGGQNGMVPDPAMLTALPKLQLAQSLMQQGIQSDTSPAYPLQALARALSHITDTYAGQKIYGQASQGLSGAFGDQASSIAATLPAGSPLIAPLTSPDPMTRYQGVQAYKAALLQQNQNFLDSGVTRPPGQAAQPTPGVGTAQGAVKSDEQTAQAPGAGILAMNNASGTATGTNLANSQPGPGGQAAVINATAQPKATAAGLEANAVVPAHVAEATGIAQNTNLIKAFYDQFQPQVDRNTGQIISPALEKPEMLDAALKAWGITRQQLLNYGIQANRLGPATAPGAAPNAAAPAATPPATAVPAAMPPATAAPTGANAAQPNAAPAAQTQPNAAAATPSPAPAASNTSKWASEVPKVPLPTGLIPGGAGTYVEGRDPIKIAAGEKAVEGGQAEYKEASDEANAAQTVQSQLGSINATLAKGGLITNVTGPIRETIAGWLYAATGNNAQLAQQITGINPEDANVVTKEGTRLGFALSRSLGAREAAQIVQQAIKVNPGLALTPEGNQKIIGILGAAAQHDIDEQQYMSEFFNQNGHYVTANTEFNSRHPTAAYTSTIIPYDIPRAPDGTVNQQALQPNVTYQGAKGPGVWTGKGFRASTPTQGGNISMAPQQ